MSGNTFKWLGGSNTNDIATAANWLIEQSGSFVSTTLTPSGGDVALLTNGGTIVDAGDLSLSGIAFTIEGSGNVLSLDNIPSGGFGNFRSGGTKIPASVIVTGGSSGTIEISGTVQSSATLAADGAGAMLTIALQPSSSFDGEGVILAEAGGTVQVTGTLGSTFTENGGLVALAGAVTVNTALGGNGLSLVGEHGVLTLNGADSAGAIAFIDNTGTVVSTQTGMLGSAILGFQAGDAIDLTALNFASLEPMSGTGYTATLSDGVHTVELPLLGATFGPGQFTIANDGHGGVLLTTSVVDPVWQNGTSGDWSTAGNWSDGAVPGTADFAVIANITDTFVVTATNEAANSVLLAAPGGTFAPSGTFSVGSDFFQMVGAVAVQAGATVAAGTFFQSSGGKLDMASGARMTLTDTLDIEGGASLTGATLDVKAGSILIGDYSNGVTLTASNASSVIGTLTELGVSGTADGVLLIDDSTWTSNSMVVGGDQTLIGGTGSLTVQDNATLSDSSAVVAGNTAASGFVTVQAGGLWSITGNLDIGDDGVSNAQVYVQQNTLVGAGAGSISVGGTLAIAGGGQLDLSGGGEVTAAALSIGNPSSVTGVPNLNIDSTSVLNIGSTGNGGAIGLVIDAGATATFDNVLISSPITDDGTIIASGSDGFFSTLAGTGDVSIAGAATLQLTSGVVSATPISFAGTGATLILSAPTAEGGTLSGVLGNTIELLGITYDAAMPISYDAASGILDVGGSGGFALQAALTLTPRLSITPVASSLFGSGTDLTFTPLCFLRGTHIATPRGEVPVEDLRIGDLVRTISGAARPLRWIGMGRALVTPRNRDRATPVVVRRHALAEFVPHRDLYLTRGHALFLDGVLIPVEELVNHRSIAWDETARVVEYYHLELDTHDVLIAEGAAAESYREDANHAQFLNAGTRPASGRVSPYAPVLHDDDRVRQVWRRLSERAGRLDLDCTADADLHLLADGIRLDPEVTRRGFARFRLVRAVASLRIGSRSVIPSMLGLGQDQRRLGIALHRARLGGAVLGWDDTRLTDGFHAAELAERHRWTDGDAALPAEAVLGLQRGSVVELHFAPAPAYPAPALRDAA